MARKKTTETLGEAAATEDPETEVQSAEETENTGSEDETAEPENEAEKSAESGMKFPDPCVYCGPSVRGIARQYTTYQGGVPAALENFIKEHPAARGLIVSTRRFPAVRRKLDTKGSAEEILYKRVKSEL